jgi:hypothetical protein
MKLTPEYAPKFRLVAVFCVANLGALTCCTRSRTKRKTLMTIGMGRGAEKENEP